MWLFSSLKILIRSKGEIFFPCPHPKTYLLIWERGREKNIYVKGNIYTRGNIDQFPVLCTLTPGWARKLGMYFDQELNLQPFGLLDNAPTEPPGQGQGEILKDMEMLLCKVVEDTFA